MKQQVDTTAAYRPWQISLGIAGAWCYGASYFYARSQGGYDSEFYLLATLLAVFMAARSFIRACDEFQNLRLYRKKRKRFDAGAKQHGPAQWAKRRELRKELLIGHNRGIFVGSFENRDVFLDGDICGVIFGSQGAGKSSGVFLPTLLNARALTKVERAIAPSFITNDTSGELYAVAHEYLRRVGYEVLLLSPWANELSAAIGKSVLDARLNLSVNIDPRNEATLLDEIKFFVKLLIPNEKPGVSAETIYFNRGGRIVIEFVCLYLSACGKKPAIDELQQILADREQLHELCVRAMENSAFKGYLASCGSKVSGMMQSADTWAGYFGVVQGAFEPLELFSSAGKHVNGAGFDPARLKEGKRPVAVFLHFPPKRIVTHHALLNAELSLLLETVCTKPGGRPVKALIDEAAGAGYLSGLLRFMAEGRKYHLGIVPGFQDLAQIEDLYGVAGVKKMLGLAHFLWASGIREQSFSEALSKMAGTTAISGGDLSLSDRMSGSAESPEVASGLTNKGVPMIQDLRTQLGDANALLIYKTMNPCILKKVPYFTRREWAARASRNPFVG